jgi:hypothetical protein
MTMPLFAYPLLTKREIRCIFTVWGAVAELSDLVM